MIKTLIKSARGLVPLAENESKEFGEHSVMFQRINLSLFHMTHCFKICKVASYWEKGCNFFPDNVWKRWEYFLQPWNLKEGQNPQGSGWITECWHVWSTVYIVQVSKVDKGLAHLQYTNTKDHLRSPEIPEVSERHLCEQNLAFQPYVPRRLVGCKTVYHVDEGSL